MIPNYYVYQVQTRTRQRLVQESIAWHRTVLPRGSLAVERLDRLKLKLVDIAIGILYFGSQFLVLLWHLDSPSNNC